MADVERQLAANSLPTQFESSSTAPEVSRSTANVAATLSNAEVSELKQHAPHIDVIIDSKPVQPSEILEPPQVEKATSENNVSLQSGTVAHALSDAQVNGHAAQEAETASQPPTAPSSVNSPLLDSINSTLPPSDMSSAIPPTHDPLNAPTQQGALLPDQAPVSDLRTAPHSDALSSEAVANVEALKHEMDNNADLQNASPIPSQPVLQDVVTKEADTGMQTPQSPPPSEPAPASAPVPAQPPAGPVVSSIEAVDSTVSDEKPIDPAPTPTPTESQDQEMVDAPVAPPPAKIVHEREEDMSDEPAPKRLKTDEEMPPADQSSFKIPESPAPSLPGSGQPAHVDADDAVTTARLQHMKKVISNLKKSNASQAFRLPVDPVALKIPTYTTIVTKPMDLGTIDTRLKRNEYHSVQAFKDDFNQIVTNCILFNGPDHSITQHARKMQSSFNNQMAQLPPTTTAEPSKMDKKAQKPKLEPIRQPAPRRQSVTGKAASPKAPSPATFAPDPNGMPLIRRDSAIDSRPKRAIVPPKRNSDFGGARPKKKKYELELRFCDETLKVITSPKHWTSNQYFTHPVDPVALNIPTYFQIIKKPMDLGTIRQKLDGAMYEKAKEFEEDVRLIFKNCYRFNPEGDYVYQCCQALEKLFNAEWAKKQDWIAAREPDSEPASVGGDDDDDEESEEEAAESEDEDQTDQVKQLQAQLDAIKNQLALASKKKKPSPGVTTKKDKKKVKKEQPLSKFPGLQPKDNKPKKPAGKKSEKKEKDRYVTFAEKQYISNGIAMLPERPMADALRIIQNSVPQLANSDNGEIELDIEEVPNHALLKLLNFVKKYAGPPPEEPKETAEYSAPAVGKPTKKKSMSKHDQEAHIAELKGQLSHYDAQSSDAMQSIEGVADDEDEDSDDQESEEE